MSSEYLPPFKLGRPRGPKTQAELYRQLLDSERTDLATDLLLKRNIQKYRDLIVNKEDSDAGEK